MISCPGLLADTEMAQRSNRRFLNLISVEVFQAVTLIRKRAGGIHHGQESLTPPKAEYIGADQTVISIFRLQFCGGPYIPIMKSILSGVLTCEDSRGAGSSGVSTFDRMY
jgi:hypothetical protein